MNCFLLSNNLLDFDIVFVEILGNACFSSSGDSTTAKHCHCFQINTDVLVMKGFSVQTTDDFLLLFISGQIMAAIKESPFKSPSFTKPLSWHPRAHLLPGAGRGAP